MESKYDIVIVGAGPAGCIAAKYLSKNFKVLLIDKSAFPRDKPCGGMLVEESVEFIKNVLRKKDDSVFSYPRSIGLENIDWNNNISLKIKRDIWNVSRAKFDYWLFDMLSDIQIEPKTLVKGFTFNDKGMIEIETDNKDISKIKTNYLIGADGFNSTVRRTISNKDEINKIRRYTAKQIFIDRKMENAEYAKFIFDNDITDFYSWVIPKDNYTLLGSAMDPQYANANFELFLNKLKEKENISGKIVKQEVALITRIRTEKDILFGSSNVLLVGETAGLISPSTGEGISFAMRSGYNCANALNNKFGNDVLEYYKESCKHLMMEIKDKIKKSDILSSPSSRLEWFNKK